MNENLYTNRLIHETSPYLLQHAHNPVDWFPWGNEAFEKAKTEDKPIFLSIGYSCCHWCHVMAHESFEDQETAKLLNDHFVSVKVDREERPDIDEAYMNVCQAMTGSGGWPLSIFMTPEKKPFYAGTYFPPLNAYGRMGFPELLERISALWKTDRDALVAQSEKISGLFSETPNKNSDKSTPDAAALVEKGYRALQRAYDPEYGGFSHAPKFPMPHYLSFLLAYNEAYESRKAVEMAEFTLTQMVRGGIFDQVGFGFSRYSTDERWLVPHFEKMLYDNALLLKAYSQCYAVTGSPLYREAADKIFTYVLREMVSPEGAFYCAQDADSEGEEGRFYVWGYEKLQSALSPQELGLLVAQYGLTKEGNFEGKNILHLTGEDAEDVAAVAVLRKLLDIRAQRVPPFKDTKISASWNGLMIEALAEAGILLNDSRYISAACRAADFFIGHMITKDGVVSGIYGKPGSGFLADYASIACALHRVYIASLDIKYLEHALVVTEAMTRRFFEPGENRFYMTASQDEALFMRPRDEYDGAMPSGAASAMSALARLYQLTGQTKLKKILDAAIEAFSPVAEASPASHIHFLSVLLMQLIPHRQIVIVAHREDAEALDAYRRIISSFAPFTSVIFNDQTVGMDALFPELTQYNTEKAFAAYVCENFTCGKPMDTVPDLLGRLKI